MSAKGIQYTYLVNYFNQVPTRVKSQVHDLPPLAVPNPTPVDIYLSQTAFMPAGDERFYAAQQNTAAAGTPTQTTPMGASQSTSGQGLVGNTATAAPVVTSAAGAQAAAPVAINTAPVVQPQTEPAANQTATPPFGELSQAVLPMNQNFAAPLPSQTSTTEANRSAEDATTTATSERERAAAEKAREEKAEYVPPVSLEAEVNLLTGGDILNPQALRLYELISGAGLVNVGGIIDTRS